MKKTKVFFQGIFRQNPVFITGLLVLPVIGAAISVRTALLISFVMTFVSLLKQILTPLFPKKIVYALKVIIHIITACLLYIPAMLIAEQIFSPETITAAGIYLPLCVINPLIGTFPEKRHKGKSYLYKIFDTLGLLTGFTLAAIFVGMLRELIANNKFDIISVNLPFEMPFAALAGGGFIIVGLLAALARYITRWDIPNLFKRENTSHLRSADSDSNK